ncbi:hypothetical protein PHMEG_00021988 [Phytophthora megakarya]|uniref:Uncharacterized protein n=1 Tax=Phytophthora megakarya TaxID=4795 RepID=A0A225VM59_9STRA|nr:hypothetical protein PHMEG_00021988 [Phytophthora megakarya]
MHLARQLNSIFLAAAELTPQPSVDNKMSSTVVTGYGVCDTNGNILPDLVSRWSCATKPDMALDKKSFSASVFGVSLDVPVAKGKANPTVDECANVEVRKINCYEELRFERPEDRDIYQRRMYGSTFVPQYLRGRTSLIIRSARYERKSTGIRFNQDRDREEFSVSLSKRYAFSQSVPRCEIPRENWQKLMRSQPAVVYLHYNNREDAERATLVFQDDSGNPLELTNEHKSRLESSRNRSSANGVETRRISRRSCSSERIPLNSSPLSLQGDGARNTAQWQRQLQQATNCYSRYDDPPSTQRNRQENYYGSSVGATNGEGRSRSRSRSLSRPRWFPNEQYENGSKRETGSDHVRANKSLLSEKSLDERVLPTCEPLADRREIGNIEFHRWSTTNKCDANGDAGSITFQRAALLTALCSPRASSQSEKELESGEEQEDGEIEDSTVLEVEITDRSKDSRNERSRSSPRSVWQPNDVQYHQRQGEYRDPYPQYYTHTSNRHRSRSRSRPLDEDFVTWDECYDDDRLYSYSTEHRSREYDPAHDYDNDAEERCLYSDMDCYGERGYRSGGYNYSRAHAHSRHS